MTVSNTEGYKEPTLNLPSQVTDETTGNTYMETGIGQEAFYGSKVHNLALPASDAAGSRVAHSGPGTMSVKLPAGIYVVSAGSATQKVVM